MLPGSSSTTQVKTVTMPRQLRRTTSVSGTTTSTSTSLKSHTKRRIPLPVAPEDEDHDRLAMRSSENEPRPSVDGAAFDDSSDDVSSTSWVNKNQWILLALASGACAAFNGVFAKL